MPHLRRSSLLAVALATSILVLAPHCSSQTASLSTDEAAEGRRAEELYKQGRFLDALPVFEKLSTEHPNNIWLKERFAWCTMQYSSTLSDPEERKKMLLRARSLGLEAKQLGDNSQLLQVLLDIPEDGSLAKFSSREDVDTAMREAEADFSRGDFDKAVDGYQHVLALDPNNYWAAVFIGDVYFKQHLYDRAGEWFDRAIHIDANQETAYRYWGDSLAAAGKDEESRARLIDAVVAEPYNRRAWVGITNWANRHKLQFHDVQLKYGAQVTQKDQQHINITLDPGSGKNDPNALAWNAYALCRASWRGNKFKKEFPDQPQYRRTLKEESDCLSMMLTVLKESGVKGKDAAKLDPGLQGLFKIRELGFLDPFVLLNRADTDISKDYEPYRAAHRDLIRRYLDEFVVPKAEATVEPIAKQP